MDQHARSTFIGIMAAVGAIALLCAIAFGIYYASTAEQRRDAELQQSIDRMECSTDRYVATVNGRPLPDCD